MEPQASSKCSFHGLGAKRRAISAPASNGKDDADSTIIPFQGLWSALPEPMRVNVGSYCNGIDMGNLGMTSKTSFPEATMRQAFLQSQQNDCLRLVWSMQCPWAAARHEMDMIRKHAALGTHEAYKKSCTTRAQANVIVASLDVCGGSDTTVVLSSLLQLDDLVESDGNEAIAAQTGGCKALVKLLGEAHWPLGHLVIGVSRDMMCCNSDIPVYTFGKDAIAAIAKILSNLDRSIVDTDILKKNGSISMCLYMLGLLMLYVSTTEGSMLKMSLDVYDYLRASSVTMSMFSWNETFSGLARVIQVESSKLPNSKRNVPRMLEKHHIVSDTMERMSRITDSSHASAMFQLERGIYGLIQSDTGATAKYLVDAGIIQAIMELFKSDKVISMSILADLTLVDDIEEALVNAGVLKFACRVLAEDLSSGAMLTVANLASHLIKDPVEFKLAMGRVCKEIYLEPHRKNAINAMKQFLFELSEPDKVVEDALVWVLGHVSILVTHVWSILLRVATRNPAACGQVILEASAATLVDTNQTQEIREQAILIISKVAAHDAKRLEFAVLGIAFVAQKDANETVARHAQDLCATLLGA